LHAFAAFRSIALSERTMPARLAGVIADTHSCPRLVGSCAFVFLMYAC